MKSLLNLFFPPLCLSCKEETKKTHFCNACWEASALLEPKGRCHHCFVELDIPTSLCSYCHHHPVLPFPRAALFHPDAPILTLVYREESAPTFASYALIQWTRLQWEAPTLISPFSSEKKEIVEAFAQLMKTPFIPLFKGTKLHPYAECEEETILLFDVESSEEELKNRLPTLLGAFPKKVYVLSLSL